MLPLIGEVKMKDGSKICDSIPSTTDWSWTWA